MKKILTKDEQIKNLKNIGYVLTFVLLILFLITVFLGVVYARNVDVAFLDGKMSMWDAGEMCVELHGRELDVDGYCDVTPEFQHGNFVHFFDCSWAKLKVRSLEKGVSLGDRWDFWMTNCERVKTVEEIR